MAKPIPLYIQIAETLKSEILNGEVKPLERLGSQREFCKRFKVSPITVEWALRRLDEEGVITRVRGRGTFAADKAVQQRAKSRRVGVVGHMDTDWETNVYVRGLYHGVQVEAQREGVLIRFYERESNYADLLNQGEVDGLIVLAPMLNNLDQLKLLDPKRHHYVVVAGDWGVEPSLVVDNVKGVTEAMKHLAELGHTRVALITDSEDSSDVRHRGQAFLDYCRRKGWPVPEGRVMHRSDYSIQGEDEEATYRFFFDSKEPPTAFLALGSNYAEDIIRILRSHGKRVPADVSVVGYDLPPQNRELQRDLTAIIQPLDKIGAKALRLLEEKIEGGQVKGRTILAPFLRIGTTTAPASAS